MARASEGARGCIPIRAHPPTHRGQSPALGPAPTHALLSPPLPGHLQRDLPLHPQSVACASLERALPSAAPGPGAERKGAPGLGAPLSGGGVPGSRRQMGEAPVGRTWMNFWEETMYHPLSLAAIQCFLPPVSLLILLIYLKELRKRRGLRWGGRTGAPTPDPHARLPEEPSSADQISFSYK